MLDLTRSEGLIRIETGTAVFGWDLKHGGQLNRVDVKSPSAAHALLPEGRLAPDLTLETDAGGLRSADSPAEVEFARQDDQCIAFVTRGEIGNAFTVEQRYEVFREGVVFCGLLVEIKKEESVRVHGAAMRFAADILGAKNVRTGYIARDPYPKQDVSCIHVLADHAINLDRDERIERDQLLPCVGLNLGWDEARYYSNRVEFVIEDSTSFGGGLLGPCRTTAGPSDGLWTIEWRMCRDANEELHAPFFYRNRWAVLVGSARTEAGPEADPARRNNTMAARICHVTYPYVHEGNEWPWTSVPMRQTFYQDVQIAAGNPEVERVDEAADLGADLLILHQFWMRCGGSNGEPMADYIPHDPAWLKATVDRAHERGMRVAVYMRGIERYSLYADFFERYLKKDWDGLYVDWCSPFSLGFAKTTAMHCSVYDWFMYVRALRRRVGEGGFLIGHTGIPTQAALAGFDSLIAGEFSVMHGGLLVGPEISASYSLLSGCGVNLIAGDSPDRSTFSSPRAAGFCAGLGYSSHPFMQPNKPFTESNAFIQPLWDLWRALDGPSVRMFNDALGTRPFASSNPPALHTVAYQAASGAALIVTANVSDETVDGQVVVDASALDLPADAELIPIVAAGTRPPSVNGNTIVLNRLEPYAFGGILVQG